MKIKCFKDFQRFFLKFKHKLIFQYIFYFFKNYQKNQKLSSFFFSYLKKFSQYL